MRLLVIIGVMLLGGAWHKCPAQFFRAGSKDQGRACSPVSIILKSKTLLEDGRWAFCADLSMNKSNLPGSGLNGNLLKQYHGTTPLYSSYELTDLLALECGAYVGVVANRTEEMGELLAPRDIRNGYEFSFDSGLVSGLSMNLEEIGKLRLRYNYGLRSVLSFDDRIVKTRRLDVGIQFNF